MPAITALKLDNGFAATVLGYKSPQATRGGISRPVMGLSSTFR